MSIRVHVRGEILAAEDARISVFDRGFLYGDSVFETLATAHGRLFALSEHLDRLERSAALIGIVPPPRSVIEAAVRDTVIAAGNDESRVRVMISRGVGWGDLDPASAGPPGLVIIVAPLGSREGEAGQMYVDGVDVAVPAGTSRTVDPRVKSGNYLPNLLALGAARRQGAHEAILPAADGGLGEGATSNLFVVAAGEVKTPALAAGILAGVTRAHVLALCQAEGISAREVAHLAPSELDAADEAFLTSSLRGVLPVTRVGGRPIGRPAGRPGPLTQRLMHAYARLLKEGRP